MVFSFFSRLYVIKPLDIERVAVEETKDGSALGRRDRVLRQHILCACLGRSSARSIVTKPRTPVYRCGKLQRDTFPLDADSWRSCCRRRSRARTSNGRATPGPGVQRKRWNSVLRVVEQVSGINNERVLESHVTCASRWNDRSSKLVETKETRVPRVECETQYSRVGQAVAKLAYDKARGAPRLSSALLPEDRESAINASPFSAARAAAANAAAFWLCFFPPFFSADSSSPLVRIKISRCCPRRRPRNPLTAASSPGTCATSGTAGGEDESSRETPLPTVEQTPLGSLRVWSTAWSQRVPHPRVR